MLPIKAWTRLVMRTRIACRMDDQHEPTPKATNMNAGLDPDAFRVSSASQGATIAPPPSSMAAFLRK